MKVKLHGTRGSYPTSNSENTRYGGSTPCVEIKAGNERLILDAGTGILQLNNENYYNEADKIVILLTHLHMDHIQGLGFFRPLFNPNKEIHIYGPGGSANSLFSRLNRFLSPPLFPIPLRDIHGQLSIHELTNSSIQIGNFFIKTKFVIHPGATIGYRIQYQDKVLTYIPDHEPMVGKQELYNDEKWLSGYDLARNADVLIHDAQYSSKEYSTKIGWGHSTMHHAAEFSKKSEVKHLVLFHHDPVHTDETKDQMFQSFMESHDYDFKIELAVQGQEINL